MSYLARSLFLYYSIYRYCIKRNGIKCRREACPTFEQVMFCILKSHFIQNSTFLLISNSQQIALSERLPAMTAVRRKLCANWVFNKLNKANIKSYNLDFFKGQSYSVDYFVHHNVPLFGVFVFGSQFSRHFKPNSSVFCQGRTWRRRTTTLTRTPTLGSTRRCSRTRSGPSPTGTVAHNWEGVQILIHDIVNLVLCFVIDAILIFLFITRCVNFYDIFFKWFMDQCQPLLF